jgi:hypothetical protein
MSKITNQDFFLQYMANNCDRVIFTILPEPILETANLASVRISVPLSSSNFELRAGNTSGRRITLLEILNRVAVGNGGIQHANFFAGSTHIHTSDIQTAFTVSNGVSYTVPSFNIIELTEPV